MSFGGFIEPLAPYYCFAWKIVQSRLRSTNPYVYQNTYLIQHIMPLNMNEIYMQTFPKDSCLVQRVTFASSLRAAIVILYKRCSIEMFNAVRPFPKKARSCLARAAGR